MANTGNLIQPILKYVTDDANEEPLDVNGVKTSISGLPQATAPNPPSSPSYKILDVDTCPVDPVLEVTLDITGGYSEDDQRFIFNAALTESLANNLTVDYSYSFTDGGSPSGNSNTLTILVGNTTSGDVYVNYTSGGAVTVDNVTIDFASPNPNGGKVIVY